MRSSIPLAISYALVTVADVTSDTHTLKIIEGLEGFELSHNMCEQIMTPKFRELNPHSLLYQLALKRLPASATMKNVAKERWWADYLTNSSVAKYMDHLFHFHGWNDQAFSQAIEPAQAILADLEDYSADDKADISEDISKAISLMLKQTDTDITQLLATTSPDASFTHKGKSPSLPDSQYHKTLADIRKDMQAVNNSDSRFRRKAAKRKLVEDTISAGDPLLPMSKSHCSSVTTFIEGNPSLAVVTCNLGRELLSPVAAPHAVAPLQHTHSLACKAHPLAPV